MSKFYISKSSILGFWAVFSQFSISVEKIFSKKVVELKKNTYICREFLYLLNLSGEVIL